MISGYLNQKDNLTSEVLQFWGFLTLQVESERYLISYVVTQKHFDENHENKLTACSAIHLKLSGFQSERPLWKSWLATSTLPNWKRPFNLKDPFGRVGWLKEAFQLCMCIWMPHWASACIPSTTTCSSAEVLLLRPEPVVHTTHTYMYM